MKTQMRFQKILALVSLIIAALSVVYALIFCSGIFNQIEAIVEYDDAFYANSELGRATGAVDLYNLSQDFSDLFLILGIILVLAVVLLYITAFQKRRKYYITNYVAIGIVIAYQVIYAVLLLVNVLGVQSAYNGADLVACKAYYEKYSGTRGTWNENPWMLYMGYVLFVVVLINAMLIGLNLLWKLKLMRGEKALLEQGLVKEVA